ncbi:MAG: glycosyltransferase [Solirubrobacterales bacterium]|nr:glycosyltransferase [Solirubrobacterales bacterium]
MEGLTLIDARAAIRAETGGVERWARELAVRLPRLRPSGYVVAEPHPVFAHRLGQPWEQCVLPLRASRMDASAILCPANLAPVASKRTVVVIHDAAPLRYPGDFSSAYTAWQRFLLPRLVRNALAVITPSEFSRRELIDLLNADPGRVHVVAPGVPDELFAREGSSPQEAQSELASQHGITGPYVLTVASKVKRKNLGALRWWLSEVDGLSFQLVLTLVE